MLVEGYALACCKADSFTPPEVVHLIQQRLTVQPNASTARHATEIFKSINREEGRAAAEPRGPTDGRHYSTCARLGADRAGQNRSSLVANWLHHALSLTACPNSPSLFASLPREHRWVARLLQCKTQLAMCGMYVRSALTADTLRDWSTRRDALFDDFLPQLFASELVDFCFGKRLFPLNGNNVLDSIRFWLRCEMCFE